MLILNFLKVLCKSSAIKWVIDLSSDCVLDFVGQGKILGGVYMRKLAPA